MRPQDSWEHLLASLRTWADPREVAGGIEVSYVDEPGICRTVELVMTPEDWEELADVIGIETQDSLRSRMLALETDTPFLVCDSGVELVASASRDLPPDARVDLPHGSRGHWVVTDERGNVVSRLADWDDDR